MEQVESLYLSEAFGGGYVLLHSFSSPQTIKYLQLAILFTQGDSASSLLCKGFGFLGTAYSRLCSHPAFSFITPRTPHPEPLTEE
jgi:hypothetical protein